MKSANWKKRGKNKTADTWNNVVEEHFNGSQSPQRGVAEKNKNKLKEYGNKERTDVLEQMPISPYF